MQITTKFAFFCNLLTFCLTLMSWITYKQCLLFLWGNNMSFVDVKMRNSFSLVGFAYMEYIARNWVGISYLESALCIPFRIQFEFFKFILNCLLLVGWNFTRLFGNIWTCCSFARLHVFVYNYTHVGCCSYTITFMWELVLVNTGVRCHLHGLDILNWNIVKLF